MCPLYTVLKEASIMPVVVEVLIKGTSVLLQSAQPCQVLWEMNGTLEAVWVLS